MGKKDLTHFVRFGGLDLVRQKGYGAADFHAPPAPRGFYAMPLIVQDLWLVSGLSWSQPAQWPKTPPDPYETESPSAEQWQEWNDFDWEKHYQREEQMYPRIRKEFRKTTGYIWHHLDKYADNREVVARHHH